MENLPVSNDPVLVINGDIDGTATNDVIRLALNTDDDSVLDVFINNGTATPTTSYSLEGVTSIFVNGMGGNDLIILDISDDGLFDGASLDQIDGGPGTDTLILRGPRRRFSWDETDHREWRRDQVGR